MANTRTAKPAPLRGRPAGNVIDLDADRAARAAKDEGQPYQVILGGHTFVIPPMTEWEPDVLEAFGGGTVSAMMDGFRLVLGDQWDDFREAKPTVGDLVALTRGLAQSAGFDSMGESVASLTS